MRVIRTVLHIVNIIINDELIRKFSYDFFEC